MAQAAGGPPVGVYACYDARSRLNPVTNRFSIEITPTPFVMFGIMDGATYSDWDGHHGHYTYDAASGILTMTDGSRQGWRYRKTGDWAFRLIDNRTGKMAFTCPLQSRKNPAHGPW